MKFIILLALVASINAFHLKYDYYDNGLKDDIRNMVVDRVSKVKMPWIYKKFGYGLHDDTVLDDKKHKIVKDDVFYRTDDVRGTMNYWKPRIVTDDDKYLVNRKYDTLFNRYYDTKHFGDDKYLMDRKYDMINRKFYDTNTMDRKYYGDDLIRDKYVKYDDKFLMDRKYDTKYDVDHKYMDKKHKLFTDKDRMYTNTKLDYDRFLDNKHKFVRDDMYVDRPIYNKNFDYTDKKHMIYDRDWMLQNNNFYDTKYYDRKFDTIKHYNTYDDTMMHRKMDDKFIHKGSNVVLPLEYKHNMDMIRDDVVPRTHDYIRDYHYKDY